MLYSLIFLELILIILGLFVFLSSPKSKVNRVFAIFILISCWWVAANAMSLSSSQSLSVFFARQITPASTFTALFFLLFCTQFTKKKLSNYTYLLLVIPAVIIVPLSWTSLNFSTTIKDGNVVYEFGMLYAPYIILLGIYLASGFWLIASSYRKSRGSERQQYLYALTGLGLSGVIALIIGAILPAIGYDGLSNFTQFTVIIGVALTGYSVVKHRLFNIRAVVARSLAYVFSIGAFAFLYAFLAFGLAQGVFLKNILTTELSREIFNVVLAVLLAFTFPTIRRFFEKITDRVFYRDRYDPQQLVSDIGRVLASEILLEQLSSKVLAIIDAQMRLATSNIVVMGEDGIFYQTHADKIQQLYHAPELAKFNKGTTIVDELSDAGKREILERHNVRAVFPLRTKESFVGYLLLGEKQSGDIFSTQDVQTLQIISDELAIAINNARSYQEIQRFNETLREKVRLATVELRHANAELKELDKAKDEFISMASHQLRTPLTAVRGYTSMVMDGDFGKVSKEQKETLKQSFDAATRMTRLVDDLLNVSRIQSGKFKIERTEVDLNKVLPEEVSMLGTAAEMKHVTITFHEPKAPVPMLQIDEGKTRQCLMNLMDNAIYYSSTAEGGGKVDVYLEADADWVSFKVKDNGIGVPKAEQPKLFQKFYRAPNAQKTRPDGTGLGLFLVGRVTKDQGGEIIFESEEGKGSTFGFKLPVKAAGEDLSATPSAEAAMKPEAAKK